MSTPKPRLLIVEDETAIRDGLVDVFTFHGYDVAAVADGQAALDTANDQRFDLVLLDLMLPKVDGFAVCETLRDAQPNLAIVMLTARVSDDDIVQGLKLGADDYVAKPFSVEQLVLRVAAVLRRTRITTDTRQFRIGEIDIDPQHLTGTSAAATIQFTRREMEVLQYLHRNNERPVPREELLSQVWGYPEGQNIETRTVDIHIAKLRKKIEANPKAPQLLATIRGAGYKLMSGR